MKQTIICLLLLLLIALKPAAAQENLLNELQSKFNSASTISADITQTTGNSGIKGKIYLKKDNMLRIEFKNTNIISDGVTIWNYNKKENKVIINNFNENDPSAFSFNKIINEYPQKSEVSLEGENVLVLKPQKSSGLNFDTVRIWVNDENLVDKVRLEQPGNAMEISISNYSLNRDIPDSRFTFTPPQGTQVIDLR